jgi:hypothetical protein
VMQSAQKCKKQRVWLSLMQNAADEEGRIICSREIQEEEAEGQKLLSVTSPFRPQPETNRRQIA